MSTFSLSSNSDSTNLAIPKLRDDGSNWSDYEPRIRKAMGSKALWRHVEGTAVAPKPFTVKDGVYLLADLKTPATDEQIEAKESRIIEFERQEYLAQHILLSTTSTRLGAKIKDMTSAEDMWKVVKDDATKKSTLYLLDAEEQLQSMKLNDDEDSKSHLMELKQHFQTMMQRRDNLITMGSTMSDTRFNIIIMSSLPDSYRPTLQTITAAERASKLSGSSSQTQQMKPDDLIAFIIEEAQHRVISDERNRNAESALAAHAKKGKGKAGKRKKHDKSESSSDSSETDSEETCDNCRKSGHGKPDCYSKGGGKEGQAPWQKKSKKGKKTETAVVAVNEEEDEFFAFVCTSSYANVAKALQDPKSRLGTCVDSGASRDYCPDRSKFSNYKRIDRNVTTADGRTIKAIGMGDMHVELPNGSKKTKVIFKNAIHAPEMAFTLISISRLDKAGYSVIFNKGTCTINNKSGRVIATIPHSDGLYRVVAPKEPSNRDYTNVTSEKMTISRAHQKPGHIAHAAINRTTWLQNRIPAHALHGKTPYEMKNKKPHLAGTQKFGAAAYMKGYRIYLPRKQSVTVDGNVVSNKNDIRTSDKQVIIPGDILAEGERDKIIQPPSDTVQNGPKTSDKTENDENPAIQTISKLQPEAETVINLQEPQSFNSVQFLPNTRSASIDNALHGPDARKRQNELKYELSQPCSGKRKHIGRSTHQSTRKTVTRAPTVCPDIQAGPQRDNRAAAPVPVVDVKWDKQPTPKTRVENNRKSRALDRIEYRSKKPKTTADSCWTWRAAGQRLVISNTDKPLDDAKSSPISRAVDDVQSNPRCGRRKV